MASSTARGAGRRPCCPRKTDGSLSHVHRFAPDSQETSARFGSFAMVMKLETEPAFAPEMNSMDRQVIRVDILPTHAGITAALRRAFEAAASEPCDRDFAELLRRLN